LNKIIKNRYVFAWGTVFPLETHINVKARVKTPKASANRAHQHYTLSRRPPFTGIIAPFIKKDSLLQRNIITSVMYLGLPSPSGIRDS